jgi:hypothetical protein
VTNWIVTLVNTAEPFDMVRSIVKAATVSEALDEKNHGHKGYWPRSASFHSVDVDSYSSLGYVFSEI